MSLPTFEKFERMRIDFLLKSDVLTAVAVVVPYTWALTRGGKKILPVCLLDPSVVVA